MFRKYVIISLALLMSLGFTACTSKKADDGSDVEVASTSDDALEEADATENNDDLEGDSSGGSSDVASDLDAGDTDDLGGGELDSGAAVADAGAGEITPNDLADSPPADMAATDAPPADSPDMSADTPPPTPDSEPAPMGDTAMADTSPPPEPESASSAPPIVPEPGGGDTASAPVVGGLKKINSTPYKQGKLLVNAVYIARDGDTVESLAQKVGSTVKDVCKINSYNCNRGIKVGDKYYYQSPQRPTDESVVKTYYEDNGMPPEIYTAKAGDNIRKVSKELLGHDRSWMEIWATNDVESKADLDEGTQLKYWPATAAAPEQTMAATDTAAPPPSPEGEPAPPPADSAAMPPADPGAPPMDGSAPPPPTGDMAAAPPPPPPPDQMAQNDLPPSPDMAAGSVEPPPPPPPPPPTDGAPPGDLAMEGAQDPDQTMMLGVGAVLLLAAAALFISIRKKRQRRQIDFNTTTQTQIE